MKDLLIAAIQSKRVIVLTYHSYTRTVEPHCLGKGPQGDMKLRCWQTAGGSVSGGVPAWKMLNVREIHSTSMSENVFAGARSGYKRDDKAMRHIYAQL